MAGRRRECRDPERPPLRPAEDPALIAPLAAALALLAAATPAPARLQVSADEFRYTLSRQALPAGPVVVELVNYGEDEHDLRLRRAGGTRTYAIGRVRPGGVRELEARLLPGRFTLWCSLPGHRARGMSASLLVRPR